MASLVTLPEGVAERRQPPSQEAAVARTILDGFDRHYRLFLKISSSARERFAESDWQAVARANRERIELYDQRVRETVSTLRESYPDVQQSGERWPDVKLAYISLLHLHLQPECAETFFNSVACQVLHRRYYDNSHIFWRPAVATDYLDTRRPAIRSYYPNERGLRRMLLEILGSFTFDVRWHDLRGDLRRLESAIGRIIESFGQLKPNRQLQVLRAPFYRNKGAYIVGRLINGSQATPIVISLVKSHDQCMVIDALITDHKDIALLFSFSRAYFMVDMETPAAYVDFLHLLMPDKPRNELYSLLGLQKHAKTLFYREFHHHLRHSRDNLVVSDGIRGMVMLVFTLPSFPFVFKVIRDRFDPPKSASREEVREKYLLVKNHDRVGRLADTLEFSNVALPLARISPALLDELQARAGKNIEIEGDRLIVRHVYIERRMTPLNTYLAQVEGAERTRIIRDYGYAIRELAGADIFPGDMMLKNFGVTRHGRVVFYDYDEICYMHECRFRRIPPSPDWMDDTSAEPWYSVRNEDVFPESFQNYFFAEPEDKRLFGQLHGELLDPAFWQDQQTRIESREQADVFPYPEAVRLHAADDDRTDDD